MADVIYRCTHNTVSPVVLEACDEIGMNCFYTS